MPTRLTARAILFDMDGTLVDSTHIVERLWRDFSAANGANADEVLRGSHGIKAVDTMRRYFPHLDAVAAAAELSALEITQHDGIVEIPGSAAFTALVPDSGFAVVTSAPRELAAIRLALCGIRVPTVVVGAEDVDNGKPNPDPYLKAAASLGIAPEDCIVFEDAPAGVQAGLSAGMRVVVVGEYTAEVTTGLPRITDYSNCTIEQAEQGFTIVLG